MEQRWRKKSRCRLLAILIAAAALMVNFEYGMECAGAAGIQETEADIGRDQKGLKDSELYAKGAVLLDGSSGRILYNKNGNTTMAMASTTKIMTCIVALEYGSQEDIYTASSYAARQPKVHLGVSEGEQFKMGDLLYSLMLESHNDAAVMIAEGVGGSVEGFASLMNQKAKELGCENTNFVTPNGLDAQAHYTTAEELAIIMKYCITQSPCREDFLKITRTASHSFTDIEKKRSFSCNNHNAFLSMMEGALSGKTGFTGNAGYCYVGALERDGKLFIVALLACGWPNNKTYKWSDTRKLMEYGLKQYEYKDIYETQSFCPILVENGQEKQVGLRVDDGVKNLEFLMREGEEVHIERSLPHSLTAPIDPEKPVGAIRYYIGEEMVKSYEVYPLEKISEINYNWCIKQVLRQFFWTEK